MAIQSVDKLVVVKAFAPANPLPLDSREIYDSLTAAHVYAASNPTAYAGQTIKVVEDNTVRAYMLVPSTKSGENFALQMVAADTDGVTNITTSEVEGNISVTAPSGETTELKNIPVVGALVNPVVDEEQHTLTLTKLGATVEDNSEVVVPLGGESVELPNTIVSGVAASEDALTVEVTKYDSATKTETTEKVAVHGAVSDVSGNTAGTVEVSKVTFNGTVAVEKHAMVGAVINASYDGESGVLTLPVVTGITDGTVETNDVVIDLVKDVASTSFTDVEQTADTETESAKMDFSYEDAAGETQKKTVYETGVRKIELGSADKVKVTVAGIDGTLTLSEILIGAGSVKNPTYDADTRVITLPVLQADGTTKDEVINLGKDLVVKSGAYNVETQEIELTINDDSVIKIPVADLIDIYTGKETATASVTVDSATNEISVDVKVSATEGNVLKAVEDGLMVSEEDLTVTKQAIADAEAAAKQYADTKFTNTETAYTEAIASALEEAKQYADKSASSAVPSFVDFGAEAEEETE